LSSFAIFRHFDLWWCLHARRADRIDQGNGIAKRNEPETLYAVFGGKVYNGGCCFVSNGNASSLL
jgi:hypothetical protein